MKRFFLFILILTAFVSCGSESESDNKCKEVICEEWLSCNADNGMCELTAGRCLTNDDCTDNKMCNETKTCVTDKSSLKVDGILYDSTVCSFIKNGNIRVLSLKSSTTLNNEETSNVEILMKLNNNSFIHTLLDFDKRIANLEDSDIIESNLKISDNEISVTLKGTEENDNSKKHIFDLVCYQEQTLNDYPKYYKNEELQNQTSKVACSVLKIKDNKYFVSLVTVIDERNIIALHDNTESYLFEMLFFGEASYDGSDLSYQDYIISDNIIKIEYSEDNVDKSTIECEIGKSVVK